MATNATGGQDDIATSTAHFFFTGTDNAVYSVDEAGVMRVALPALPFTTYRWLLPFEDKMAVSGFDATGDGKLWFADGTPGGVTSLSLGFLQETSEISTVVNGVMFLFADPVDPPNQDKGVELYATDGSTMWLVKDIVIGEAGSAPGLFGCGPLSSRSAMVTVGSYCVFAAREGGADYLWRTDGTPEGTVRLSSWALASNLQSNGSSAFFRLFRPGSSAGELEVWTTDGNHVGRLPGIGSGQVYRSAEVLGFSRGEAVLRLFPNLGSVTDTGLTDRLGTRIRQVFVGVAGTSGVSGNPGYFALGSSTPGVAPPGRLAILSPAPQWLEPAAGVGLGSCTNWGAFAGGRFYYIGSDGQLWMHTPPRIE